MSQHPPDRTLSPADPAADNERVRNAAVAPDVKPPAKADRAHTLAVLLGKLAKAQTVVNPDTPQEQPAIVEEVKPQCETCGGRGKIKYAVPLGDPRFGKMFDCPNPNCEGVRHYAQQRFVSLSEIAARQFGGAAEYYDYASMSHYDDDYRLAVKCARLWIKDGQIAGKDTVKRSLVIYGKVGTGKTHLISAMRNELWQRNVWSLFLKVRTMIKGVQHGYSEDAEMHAADAENLLRTAPVLFIDELEVAGRSGDKTDILETVIDYRCLHDLPTVIATNLEQDELAQAWNHRIQSRLVHMAWWVALDDKSRRDTSPGMKVD